MTVCDLTNAQLNGDGICFPAETTLKILGSRIEDTYRDPVNPTRIWARCAVRAVDEIGDRSFEHTLTLALWVRMKEGMTPEEVLAALDAKLAACVDRIARYADVSSVQPINTNEATWWH